MALTDLALRTAAIEALRGRTIAGDTIIDTAGSIGDSEANAPRFSVVVASIAATDKVSTMAISLGVWKRDIVPQQDEAGNVGYFYAWMPAALDAAAQLALDVLEHQVISALKAGSDWAKVWNGLATELIIESGRGADPEVAQRELLLKVTFARPVGDAWRDFRALVTASKAIPEPLKAILLSEGGLPFLDWAALGLDCGVPLEPAPAEPVKPEKPIRPQPKVKDKAKRKKRASAADPARSAAVGGQR